MSCYEMDFELTDSSLIKSVSYDDELLELTLEFRETYFKDKEVFIEFYPYDFAAFTEAKSFGKYYLNFIKSHFKLKKMAEKPRGVNKAKNAKRYIRLNINVKDINKDWLVVGEKGTYLNATLQMLPDGDTDRYENLGMITQDVPKDVREKNKETKGAILGNAIEQVWGDTKSTSVATQGNEDNQALDDLPF